MIEPFLIRVWMHSGHMVMMMIRTTVRVLSCWYVWI